MHDSVPIQCDLNLSMLNWLMDCSFAKRWLVLLSQGVDFLNSETFLISSEELQVQHSEISSPAQLSSENGSFTLFH